MPRILNVFLRPPEANGEGQPILFIPGQPRPTRIEIEQVLNSVMAEIHAYVAQFGGFEYRLETPNPDEGPLGHRQIEVRPPSEFVRIGHRSVEPWMACRPCRASNRVGFANRKTCEDCYDGLRGFHLALGSVGITVYAATEEQQPLLWSCRIVAPQPIGLSLGRWFGWLRTDDDTYIAESALEPSSLDDVVAHAERVAEEVEQLAPDLM